MTTYNTNNPLGSSDPRDLYDNSENMDVALNGTASDTWVDRKGVTRKSWAGIEAQSIAGALVVDTVEDLQEIVPEADTAAADVTKDPDPENNGRWAWDKTAAEWYKVPNDTDEKIEAVNQVVIDNKLPVGRGNMVDAVVDKKTRAAYWYVDRRDGRYYGTPGHIGRNIGEKVFHPLYAEIEHDNTPQRNIVWARKRNGDEVSLGGAIDTELDLETVMTPEGRLNIIGLTDTQKVKVASAFDSYKPRLTGGRINYKEKGSVKTYDRYKEYPFSQFDTGTYTRIIHVMGYGQSLSVGQAGDPTLTTPLMPNQVFMLNVGILTLGQTHDMNKIDYVVDPAGLQNAIPAFSQIREAPALSGAYEIAKANPDALVIVSVHGIGGLMIGQLWRGNTPYDNLVYTASMVKALADSNGVKYEIAPIQWIQGTADWNNSLATYTAKCNQLYIELNEDLKAISGQESDIMIMCSQTPSGAPSNDGNLAFAQVEIALNQPTKWRCFGPRYFAVYMDNSHLDGPSYVNVGGISGRASVPPVDTPWLPLHPVSAVRSGTTVTLTMHNPSGTALVLDLTRFDNYPDGNYGFFWRDGSNSAVITNVAVSGTDTVTLTLDQVPTGANPQVRIADRTNPIPGEDENKDKTGKRCALRDSSADLDSLGNRMYNWACIFRINVTQ